MAEVNQNSAPKDGSTGATSSKDQPAPLSDLEKLLKTVQESGSKHDVLEIKVPETSKQPAADEEKQLLVQLALKGIVNEFPESQRGAMSKLVEGRDLKTALLLIEAVKSASPKPPAPPAGGVPAPSTQVSGIQMPWDNPGVTPWKQDKQGNWMIS